MLILLAVVGLGTLGANVFAGSVPDTGQARSFTKTFGEDSDYSIHPPSYTKLDEQGRALPFSSLAWATVRDNVTGLVWEVKSDDGSVHDRDNRYTWYDPNPDTDGGNAGTPGDGTDTYDFIRALNDSMFGGFSDWRIPTLTELAYIIHHGRWNPAIHIAYFPNTAPSVYWSSITDAHYSFLAWGVDFGYGYVGANYKLNFRHIRAVRGE